MNGSKIIYICSTGGTLWDKGLINVSVTNFQKASPNLKPSLKPIYQSSNVDFPYLAQTLSIHFKFTIIFQVNHSFPFLLINNRCLYELQNSIASDPSLIKY